MCQHQVLSEGEWVLCRDKAVVTTDAPKSQGPKGPPRTVGISRKRVWAKLLGTLGPQPYLAGPSPTAAHSAALEESPGSGHMRLLPPLGLT